ncbi:MAG TPA: cytochrome c oxidase subunit II [Kofleriaceae bacterium]|jgi:cytochrome c oxidase subunit 2
MKRALPVLVALLLANTSSAQTPDGSAGSAAPAGSAAAPATGSAAATADGSAGSAGSAAPKEPAITVVACPSSPGHTLVGPGLQPYDSVNKVGDFEVPMDEAVRFDLATDLTNDTPAGAGIAVHANAPICIKFHGAAKYPVHSANGHGEITVKAWYDVLADLQIEESGNFFLPRAVNKVADDSDRMFIAVLALSVFFFVAIAGVVIYFVIKYRHRPGHKAEPSAGHNDTLEITWTVIPTIICVFLFWYGWQSYIRVVTPPNQAVEIDVLAWQWNWQFTHQNGVTDSDLHVPAGVPVRLVMTSKDVIHSFYAPAMRVKQDVLPRRFTYAWFEATKPGTYRLTCAEYCGTNHSQMACLEFDKATGACLRRAVVVVHKDLAEYKKYLDDKLSDQMKLPPVELGALLYQKKGCSQCHTVDGTPRIGPTWKQPDWGKMITMDNGQQVKMDENYVTESILNPSAKARPGFPKGTMPSFDGQLKPSELNGLIQYIKSLKQ